ncbi:hypothetical protein ABTG52_07130, partial [Acinetobacter baumannii]
LAGTKRSFVSPSYLLSQGKKLALSGINILYKKNDSILEVKTRANIHVQCIFRRQGEIMRSYSNKINHKAIVYRVHNTFKNPTKLEKDSDKHEMICIETLYHHAAT